jgi:hypothetical protein
MFGHIMMNLVQVYAEIEEDDQLSMFIGLLEKFNHREPMKQGYKEKIRDFFDYKWKKDKNICLID